MTDKLGREEWMNAQMEEGVSISEVIFAQIKRINFLHEELDKLNDVVKKMSDEFIRMSDFLHEFSSMIAGGKNDDEYYRKNNMFTAQETGNHRFDGEKWKLTESCQNKDENDRINAHQNPK